MRLLITALSLVSPAILLAAENASPTVPKTAKIPAISMLPNGSELKNVLIPRYDENRHLTTVLKSTKMILVTNEQIAGELVTIEFFNSDQTPRGRIDLKQAVFFQNKNLVVARDAVEMKSARMRTYGTALYYSIEQNRGFLVGPVTSIIENPPAKTP